MRKTGDRNEGLADPRTERIEKKAMEDWAVVPAARSRSVQRRLKFQRVGKRRGS